VQVSLSCHDRGDSALRPHSNQINTHLSSRDNTFAKFSTGLRDEITDLFYLTMSLNTDYETDPPPGTKKEDTTWGPSAPASNSEGTGTPLVPARGGCTL
jgi:hypothetical protein